MKFGSIRAVGQVIATGSISSATTTILTGSGQLTNLGYATTGSNTFTGTQTMAGSIIPSVNNTYDLGSPTYQFRHVYISSGSLYVNGTKVLGSTSQELQITTDVGQSFKILESGSDTITLQSADGNITLTSSGGGDVILDPNTGVIALKGTTTVYSGYKIVSSDGNAIQFGNGIAITGSIVATGTSLVSGSSQITFSGLSGIPSGLVSGSSQILSGTGIISSSAQESGFGYATTGSNTFQGAQTINGSLNVIGNLTAQQYVVSSSVTYLTESFTSGSHKFGDSADDYHDFTGSVRINGSITSTGTSLVSGSSQISYTGLSNIPSGIISGSSQLPSGTVSGSSQISYTGLSNIPSGIISGSSQLPSGTVSGSSQVLNGTTIHSGSFFNGISVVSGSAQVDVMLTTNISRLATTGSNTFTGTIAIGSVNDGAGTLYVTASASTNAARLRNNDASYGTLDVLNTNASGFGIYAVANKHFISGSIGLNTTSPSLQTNGVGLNISSNTNQFPVLRLERITGGGGSKTLTNWEWVIGSSGQLVLQHATDTYEPLTIEYNTTSNAIYLKSNNNIGLSTASPQYRLHIAGGGIGLESNSQYRNAISPSYWGYSTSYRSMIIGSASATYNVQDGAVSLAFNVDVSANTSPSFTGDGSEYLWRNTGSFKTPNSSNNSYNTLLTWNSSGQFTFNNAATFSSNITVSGGITGSGGSLVLTGTPSDTIQNSGAPFIYLSGGGSNYTTIQQGSSKMRWWQFNGSSWIKTWDIDYNGNATLTGTFTENSSIRYKENVETVRYGLDKVLQMRGVTYNKKDNGIKEMGVIAEEINEILPEVVLKNDEGEVDSVSYGRITAVLIEAIKELKSEIEELKSSL